MKAKEDVTYLHPDGDKESEPKDKKETAKRIAAKVLCVFGALLIWLYVMSNDSPDYERVFNSVPVAIVGATELESNTGMSLVSGQGHLVDITVTGRKSDVVKLTLDDIVANINIADIKNPDKYTLDIDVSVPSGITITSVSPDNATVSVDKTSSITLRVVPKLTSYTISSEYIMGALVPEVDEISVSGPLTVLETLDRAEIVIGDLGNISGTVTANGMVQLVDRNGDVVTNRFIRVARDSMNVTVPINMYKDIPIKVEYKHGFYNSNNVDIKLNPSFIKVRGDVALLSGLDVYNITVDEKKIQKDTTITQSVTLPEGVENVNGVESVSVDIKHKNTTTKTISVNTININNPSNIECELITASVAVKFRGAPDALTRLEEENVTVTADISTVATNVSGVITLPVDIDVSIPEVSSSVYELGEYTVELRIK